MANKADGKEADGKKVSDKMRQMHKIGSHFPVSHPSNRHPGPITYHLFIPFCFLFSACLLTLFPSCLGLGSASDHKSHSPTTTLFSVPKLHSAWHGSGEFFFYFFYFFIFLILERNVYTVIPYIIVVEHVPGLLILSYICTVSKY